MGIQHLFDDASRIMTVVSFVSFLGIVAWAYVLRTERDFDATAAIPFDDELEDDYV